MGITFTDSIAWGAFAYLENPHFITFLVVHLVTRTTVWVGREDEEEKKPQISWMTKKRDCLVNLTECRHFEPNSICWLSVSNKAIKMFMFHFQSQTVSLLL